MMYQHLTVPPPSAESFGVTLQPGIEEVIRKALEKEPENRYTSLDIMLSDLNSALGRPTSPGTNAAVTEILSGRSSFEAAIPRPSIPGPGFRIRRRRGFIRILIRNKR